MSHLLIYLYITYGPGQTLRFTPPCRCISQLIVNHSQLIVNHSLRIIGPLMCAWTFWALIKLVAWISKPCVDCNVLTSSFSVVKISFSFDAFILKSNHLSKTLSQLPKSNHLSKNPLHSCKYSLFSVWGEATRALKIYRWIGHP